MQVTHYTPRLILLAAFIAGSSAAFAQNVDVAEKKLLGAEGLLARAQYDLARQEFADFLKQFPADPRISRARFGLAVSAYNLNDAATALAPLEALAGDKSFPRREDALALLGTVSLDLGHPDRALAALDALLQEFPKGGQAQNASVNRAQALCRLGRFDDSLTAVRGFLTAAPNSPLRASALYVAALDQRGLGDETGAATTLQEVVAKFPNSPFTFDAQLLIGETLADQGKFDDAIAYYRKLQDQSPESQKPAAEFGLGNAYTQAGKYAEARKTFDHLAATYRDSPYAGPAKLQQAVALLKSGDRALARPALQTVAREYPALAASAAYWSARCDLLDSKFDAAQTALKPLVGAKIPEAAEVDFDLAYCELMLAQDAAALQRLETFRAAYPRSPHMPEALYYEASALHRTGDFAKSIQFCDAIAGFGKTTVARPAVLLKGENLLLQGQYAKADAQLATLEKNPASEDERLRVALRRGQCAYFSGNYSAAELRLASVARSPEAAKDPTLQESAFLLGDAQLQEGKHADAVTTFKSYLAIPLNSRADEATFKLALAQIGNKDEAAGIETLRELMKGDPRNEWIQRAWFEYAHVAFEQGKPDEATRAIRTLLAAKPAENIAAPAAYLMARIEMDAGKFTNAAARLEALIHDFPKHPLAEESAYVRGICLKNAHQPADALHQFTAYLQKFPAGKYAADARHQAAVCLTAMGKTDDAVKSLLELAAHRDTRNAGVLYDLAWAYRGSNDSRDAIDTYQTLLKEFPDGPRTRAARVELPELLFADKRYKEAADLLTAAINDPATEANLRALATYRLGHCYARLGQSAKSAAMLDAFAAAAPHDSLAPDAISEAGAQYALEDKLDEAMQRQARVISEFANTAPATLAMLRLGEEQNQGGQYDAAEQTFTRWLQEHGKDPLRPRADFGLGWSLENRAKPADAREAYARVVAADNGPLAARAQFQIGETYFAQKKYDQAAAELLKVDILYAAPEWAARALYEAGRAFEETHDLDRAKTQFRDCLRKYKDSDVALLAKKRLEALGG